MARAYTPGTSTSKWHLFQGDPGIGYGPMSMSIWTKPTPTSGVAGNAFNVTKKNVWPETRVLSAGGAGSGHKWGFTVGSSVRPTLSTWWAGNDWEHACGTTNGYDDHAIYAYRAENGNTYSGTSSAEISQLSSTDLGVCIGGKVTPAYHNLDHSTYYDGSLAEAAIWNIQLSAAEVAQLQAGVSPLMVRPDSLVLYVPLNDGGNGDVLDIVGGATFTHKRNPATTDHPPGLFYPTGPTIFPFSGGGVSVDGSISATGSISGIVGLELPLSGSVSASSGLDGVLDLTIGFSGTSSAASAVSGSMVASYSASGEASSVASISGSIAAPGEFIAAADSSWTADSKGRSWTVDDAGREWTVQ